MLTFIRLLTFTSWTALVLGLPLAQPQSFRSQYESKSKVQSSSPDRAVEPRPIDQGNNEKDPDWHLRALVLSLLGGATIVGLRNQNQQASPAADPDIIEREAAKEAKRQKLIEEMTRHAYRRPIALYRHQHDLVRQSGSQAVQEYPLAFIDALHKCMRDNMYRVFKPNMPSYKADEMVSDYILFGKEDGETPEKLKLLLDVCRPQAIKQAEELKREIEEFNFTEADTPLRPIAPGDADYDEREPGRDINAMVVEDRKGSILHQAFGSMMSHLRSQTSSITPRRRMQVLRIGR